ncbi:MAG: aminopeptidase P family protein [Methylobacteriaceae bacterium]|jgi:Xaa-Pro aminopeptidase|nr:aminopeptidase P family protein [Methylobacteriaceae bacterium]
MHQSFAELADPSRGVERAALLRREMKTFGLDGLIVPRADEYQSEYAARHVERLAWLTGFTGSAGNALVLPDRAVIVVDGRYTVQVREQVDEKVFEPIRLAEQSLEDWISLNVPAGVVIGYDPWLHTVDGVKKLKAAVDKAGATLKPTPENLLDRIRDIPAPVVNPVYLHDEAYAGESAAGKLARVEEALTKDRCDALVIVDPHALMWVFNLRGSDISKTPLAMGHAVLRKGAKARIFLDYAPVPDDVRQALAPYAEFLPRQALLSTVEALGRDGLTVRFDAAFAVSALVELVNRSGGTADVGADPISLMKACKNAVEIEGARRAHRRDGIAMIRFLAWLDREAPSGLLTEIATVEALEKFRFADDTIRAISFASIAGAGPNSALPHYRVTERSNRALALNDIFLMDSGGQYPEGTTDITRTVIVGEATADMKRKFTLVLKGMIALATAVFPEETTGAQIDAFARQFLWRNGVDFDHGTGHGIGSYLSVHEGPQRIARTGHVPLKPGMIVSDEPGYYRAGAWGIRIENLLLVEPRAIPGAEGVYYGFETLSFTPIDQRLIERELLTADERAWLDAYHARTFELFADKLDGDDREWLSAATRPIV